MTGRFELVDHTGDLGVRGVWRELPRLFEQAAHALTYIFTDPATIQLKETRKFLLEAKTDEVASIWGAVVGAAVLTLLPQFLTVLKDYEMMVFGAVLIATMVFFPRGIVPTLARALARR